MEKNYRLNYIQYNEMKKQIMSKRESVDDWAEVSLSGKLSIEELTCRMMMNNDPLIPTGKYICIAYVCSAYPMSEEYVRDLIYINSGIALLGCWNEKVIDWVVKLHSNIVSKSTYKGNALDAIKNALSSGYFEDVPEYSIYLNALLKDYRSLEKKILSYNVMDLKDAQTIASDITMFDDEICQRFLNYTIEIRDRLDWTAIESNNNLSDEFIESHSKRARNLKSQNPFDDDYLSPISSNDKNRYVANEGVNYDE